MQIVLSDISSLKRPCPWLSSYVAQGVILLCPHLSMLCPGLVVSSKTRKLTLETGLVSTRKAEVLGRSSTLPKRKFERECTLTLPGPVHSKNAHLLQYIAGTQEQNPNEDQVPDSPVTPPSKVQSPVSEIAKLLFFWTSSTLRIWRGQPIFGRVRSNSPISFQLPQFPQIWTLS